MRKGTLISICIVIVGIIIAYSMIKSNLGEKELPIIQPVDVNSEMVNPEIMNQGLGHRIGEFEFRNQYNQKVSLQDVKGKIFIAEYFFTTCQTICPIMTDEMMRVQSRFRGNDEVKILSFTVDPDIDTVETLKAYAEKHQAQKGQWHFLTGKKEELYQLARNSFFVLKPAEARNLGDANSDFIHTNNFVLVDRALQIRGYYDGTNPQEVNTLMDDIELLLKEK